MKIMKIDHEPISPAKDEVEDDDNHLDGPSHNPYAPSDEVFNVSTTVDPSYVISLIRKLIPGDSDETLKAGEEAWEEHGCVLWDLAASKTHADLMVENLLLEVLTENFRVQQSVRSIEISLGILGNIACHDALMKRVISTNGLIDLIVNQLSLDDTQCLCEACRLLSLGLRSSDTLTWGTALQAEHVLCRILWIAENSLNQQLIEKSVELLLDIIESSEEVSSIVVPPLIKMGLASVLISLLGYEVTNLTTERTPERLPILDVVLRAIEALSVIDGHSKEISSNKKLFQLVCELAKLQDKAEVANSCVTAAVLIANILSDEAEFSKEISFDLDFLGGLLEIFPYASGDSEARGAIWNIMLRLVVQVPESDMSSQSLGQYVSVLTGKSDLIEDDLLDLPLNAPNSKARTASLTRISDILNHWAALEHVTEEETAIDFERLLRCCERHVERGVIIP